jgi:aspartate racemase
VSRPRLVGVLGGMGPAATVDFMAKVIAATPATRDQDHVPLLVYQATQIPDRPSAVRDGTDEPLGPMLEAVRVLEGGGAEAIAIVCNTAHHWFDALAAASRVPLLHIADAARESLIASGGSAKRVALLATRATIATGIYDRVVPDLGPPIVPDEPVQRLVDRAIAAVKASDLAAAQAAASVIADELLAAGAERLLLACTELPVAFARVRSEVVVDATDALARACVRFSLGDAHLARRSSDPGRPLA